MTSCDASHKQSTLTSLQMVQDLTAMLVERLVFFKANERALPERVIIYRDGVSEVGRSPSPIALSY